MYSELNSDDPKSFIGRRRTWAMAVVGVMLVAACVVGVVSTQKNVADIAHVDAAPTKGFLIESMPQIAPRASSDTLQLGGTWIDTSGYCTWVRQNVYGGLMISPGSTVITQGHWKSGAGYVYGSSGYVYFVYSHSGGHALRINIASASPSHITWSNGVTWYKHSSGLESNPTACRGAVLDDDAQKQQMTQEDAFIADATREIAPRVLSDSSPRLDGTWRDTSGYCFYVRENDYGGFTMSPGSTVITHGHWKSAAGIRTGTTGYGYFVYTYSGGHAWKINMASITNNYGAIHWSNGVTWNRVSTSLSGCPGAVLKQ